MTVRRADIERYAKLSGQQPAAMIGLLPLLAGTDLLLRKGQIMRAPWGQTLHGEHRLERFRDAQFGERLTTTARVAAVDESPSRTRTTLELLTVGADSRMCARQTATMVQVQRRSPAGASALSRQEADVTPGDVATVRLRPDLTLRYAELSGDANLIHIDGPLARALGFKGVIVQGLCTMAIVTGTVLARRRSPHFTAVSVRFRRPLYPGDELIITSGRVPAGLGMSVRNHSGEVVLGGVIEGADDAATGQPPGLQP